MDKKLLRKELLAVRQEIAATRPEAAKELARNIVGWLEANPQFSSVGLYYPIQSEPDLMEALGAWQSEKPGRMLALPVVMKGKMGYYQWTPGVEMVESGFHIMVPKEKIPVVPQVLLAPCIGFSDIGCRLGYGAGWLDRTLFWANLVLLVLVPVDLICPSPVMRFLCDTVQLNIYCFTFTWLRMIYVTFLRPTEGPDFLGEPADRQADGKICG